MTTAKVYQVYVGTYAKYNNGDLTGEWVDLTDYSSKEEFLEYCKELHDDEDDPEFMYQDNDGVPDRYFSESGISAEFWEFLRDISDMSDDEQEAYQDFIDNGSGDSVEGFRDAYQGQYGSETEFAKRIVDECYDLSKMGHLAYYFDYEKFGRDLFMGDYWMSENGHVFRNI